MSEPRWVCPSPGCAKRCTFHLFACPEHMALLPERFVDPIEDWASWGKTSADEYYKAREAAITWLQENT